MEWWRHQSPPPTRDYFRVEDDEGQRYWLYRSGGDFPQWFLHGLFRMSAYAEIAVTTNYSFLRGASHPGELVQEAAALGHAAIGIADRNTLAGIVRAYAALQEIEGEKPKLLVGARLVFVDGTPDILAYPADRAAYGRLCRLLSAGKLRAPKGDCILTLDDLLKWQEGLLLVVMPPHPARAEIEKRDAGKFWNESLALADGDVGAVPREAHAHIRQSDFAEIEFFWINLPFSRPAASGSAFPCRIWAMTAAASPSGSRVSRGAPLLATNDVLYHCARAARIAGCRHLHPRACDAGRGGPASGNQCRAASEIAGRNGAAFPRCAGGASPKPSVSRIAFPSPSISSNTIIPTSRCRREKPRKRIWKI